MNRFFFKIIALILIVTFCDFAVGLAGNFLVEHAKGGETYRKTYIANKTNDDVLVFGSSRVLRHYDPTILEDSLGKTVYNCGFEGFGILCEYGLCRMAMNRYTPSVIIYDVYPKLDLLKDDNHTYLAILRLFYDETDVSEIFNDVDKTEKYKMVSRMYRYNSVFPQLMSDNIHPHYGNNGYRPVDAKMVKMVKPSSEPENYDYDSLKISYLEKLIIDCKGKTKLIFTVSPLYSNTSSKVLEPLVELCNKYDVPLINSYINASFNQNAAYFYDPTHMNKTGATEYTKYVASKLKEYL